MKRQPAVAGTFYTSNPRSLASTVRKLSELSGRHPTDRVPAIGVMSPHAGIVYSGRVAAEVFSTVEPAGTYLLIGPNHTGYGPQLSIMAEGTWIMPGGELAIDSALAAAIMRQLPVAEDDTVAHMHEHSLELQLPFIMDNAPDAMIVPMVVMGGGADELIQAGHAIARAVKAHGRKVLIVASSDMSHFISDAEARQLDKLALDRVLALDPEGLYSTVRTNHISMCGVLPATMMLAAARELGATRAELLSYTTSAEVSGDHDRVVGYAGVVVS